MRLLCRLGAVSACAISLAVVTSVNAAPVYTGTYVDMYLKQNTFPPNLLEDKVYLEEDTATTITGHVGSQTGTPLVIFSSTTDTLVANNGFSSIKSVDGYLNNIMITAPGYWFEDLIFSVMLSNGNSDLSVTAENNSGGTDVNTAWTLANGENRILVLAKGDNLMQSVTVDSSSGFNTLGGLNQFKQTEISGLTVVPAAIPVPNAIWLFGSGLLGMAAVARRKMPG